MIMEGLSKNAMTNLHSGSLMYAKRHVSGEGIGIDVAPSSIVKAVAAGAVGKGWSILVDIIESRCDSNVSNSSVTIVPIVLPGHPSARMLKLDDWGHKDRL